MPIKFLANLVQAFRRDNPVKTTGSPDSHARQSEKTVGIGAMIAKRYRLDAEFGRGGMGIVYRARDIPNNRDVAIKVINVREADARARQQFLREAEITARLNHSHIVSVYETGTCDRDSQESSPFIVMESIQGPSLREMRGLTFSQIVDLGRQICDALEYAHAQGLVHRDLKPENVLLEKRGFRYFAKLADFGLARPPAATYLPSESNLAGTIYYLAPEVIAGQLPDTGTDLYALGVMLYEMVTGRVPFSDFDEQTILSQHLHQSVVPPSRSRDDVPPALESIILRLLAKDPKDRFATAREVGVALKQSAIAPEPIASRGNLPRLTIRFAERENEIAQVKQLLESSQLVTLLGDDSTGSTRLALATGLELADQFSDGVWRVDFAPLSAPALVPQTVASILGVHEESRRALTVSLIEYLREKNLMLLLYHCDRVTGACAQLAEAILQTCPEVHILATARQPLSISGEMCYRTHSS